jgi:hypothetical protein
MTSIFFNGSAAAPPPVSKGLRRQLTPAVDAYFENVRIDYGTECEPGEGDDTPRSSLPSRFRVQLASCGTMRHRAIRENPTRNGRRWRKPV